MRGEAKAVRSQNDPIFFGDARHFGEILPNLLSPAEPLLSIALCSDHRVNWLVFLGRKARPHSHLRKRQAHADRSIVNVTQAIAKSMRLAELNIDHFWHLRRRHVARTDHQAICFKSSKELCLP